MSAAEGASPAIAPAIGFRRPDGFAIAAAPGLLYLAVLFALPLTLLLAQSFRAADGSISIAGYVSFFSDPYNLTVTWRTLRVALLTTLLCLVLAYPTALALARATGVVQSMILIAMVLPLSVGVIVKAFSWSIVLRSDGIVNSALLGLGLVERPVRMLFTESALVVGAANVFLPFMVLPIYAVMRQMDPLLSPAAATLGAGPFRRFFKVQLPLTLPGVIAGVAFVFSLAVSMYVIPSLIVGERQSTLSMLIARSFLYYRDAQLGSTISAILLLIAIAVVLGSSWLVRRTAEGPK